MTISQKISTSLFNGGVSQTINYRFTLTFFTQDSSTDIAITVSDTCDIEWAWADGTTDTTADPGTKDMSATDGYHTLTVSDYRLITEVNTNLWGSFIDFSLDIQLLRKLISLTLLSLYNTSCEGGILNLSAMTGLTQLYLSNTACEGNISSLSAMTGLTRLYLNNTDCYGDILNLSAMTGLTQLYLNNTDCYGDISSLSAMTGLTRLYLTNTDCYGDISSLSAMTGLTRLYLSNTACEGNISSLSAMTGLTQLILYDTNISETDMSSMVSQLWSIRSTIGSNLCVIQIQNCNGITSTATAMIEGTGIYLGDGLKDAGCTITY